MNDAYYVNSNYFIPIFTNRLCLEIKHMGHSVKYSVNAIWLWALSFHLPLLSSVPGLFADRLSLPFCKPI